MKRKVNQIYSKRRFQLLLLTLFLAVSSAFGGSIILDNSKTATAVAVPDTIGMLSDLYSCNQAHDLSILTDDKLDRANVDDFWYYKISSSEAGTFKAVISAASKNGSAKINVSLYNTDSSLVDAGDTINASNGSWGDWTSYTTDWVKCNFEFNLAKDVVYLMKVTQLGSNGNIRGMIMTKVDTSPDAHVRTIPTVDGDENTEFLMMSHSIGSSGTITVAENGIGSTKNNAYVEYEIKSPIGGVFNAVLQAGTERIGASLNVSVYKRGDTFVKNGIDLPITIGAWGDLTEYHFPTAVALEANAIYIMRITFNTTVADSWVGNVNGIAFEIPTGSSDASLSDLKVGGVSIDGFSFGVMDYTKVLARGTVDVPVTVAETTVEGATAVVTNAISLGDTTKVVVTSQDGTVESIYTIAFLVQGPYSDVVPTMPGVVQFEHWDVGGESYAYHDTENGGPRLEEHNVGTDTVYTNVAYTQAGEWLTYTVNVAKDADYKVTAHVASRNSGGNLTLYIDEDSITTFTVENTGAWQTYATNIVDTTMIIAGEHVIKWEMSGSVEMNLEYFELVDVTPIPTSIFDAEINELRVYSTKGLLSIQGTEDMIGSSVNIYDVSGRLVISQLANSTHERFAIANSGLYIVRVVDQNDVVRTTKCFVR